MTQDTTDAELLSKFTQHADCFEDVISGKGGWAVEDVLLEFREDIEALKSRIQPTRKPEPSTGLPTRESIYAVLMPYRRTIGEEALPMIMQDLLDAFGAPSTAAEPQDKNFEVTTGAKGEGE